MQDYTILIIDYDPRSIERMRVPLERAGYKVEVALDGLKGMESFNTLLPQLTLIEAMIPKKHGFEVCQELKATPHGQKSPIFIVTSGYRGSKHRTNARHHYRCDEFLLKPINDDDLLAAVHRHVGSPEPVAAAAPATGQAVEIVDPALSPVEDEIISRLDSILPD